MDLKDIGLGIWSEKKLYIWIILQLSISILFLSYSLDHVFSKEEQKRGLLQGYDAESVSISIVQIRLEDDVKFLLSAEEIRRLEEVTEGRFSYFTCVSESAFEEEKVVEYCELFSSDMKVEQGTVLISRSLWKRLKACNSFWEGACVPQGDRLIRPGEEERAYRVTFLSKDMEEKHLLRNERGESLKLKDCILFPAGEERWVQGERSWESKLQLQTRGLKHPNGTLNHLLRELDGSSEGQFMFLAGNMDQGMQEIFQRAIAIPVYLGKMAGILLVVSLFGIWGAFSVILKKREQEFAVRIAIGAGRGNLICRMVTEIFLVAFGGWAAGSLAGRLLLILVPYDQMLTVRAHLETQGVTFLLLLLLTGCLSALPVHRLLNLRPEELLTKP